MFHHTSGSFFKMLLKLTSNFFSPAEGLTKRMEATEERKKRKREGDEGSGTGRGRSAFILRGIHTWCRHSGEMFLVEELRE